VSGGFLEGWRLRRLEKRARKEARARVREVRGILRDFPFRIPEPVRQAIGGTCDTLEQARTRRDHDGVSAGLVKLDEQAREHLSFAGKSTFREYAESIAVAVLIALLLRAFVVEAFKIPSASMIPTMEVGDHIFVNKFIYGVRIPFTKLRFFEWRRPRRGEVIVFIYPCDPAQDFIKRVVAIEGDTIEVRNNALFINKKPVSRFPVPGPCIYWDHDDNAKPAVWRQKRCAKYKETIGDEVYYTIDELGSFNKDFPGHGDPDPYVVPKDHVFVVGDNRNNSHDSRYWGPVPIENIKGKAMVIWYSSASPAEERFFGVRWDRLGDTVD